MPFCAGLRAVRVGDRPRVAVEKMPRVHRRGMPGLKGFDRGLKNSMRASCYRQISRRFLHLVVPLVVYPQVCVISFAFRPNSYTNEDFPRFTDLPAFANRPWPAQKLLRLGWHCDT